MAKRKKLRKVRPKKLVIPRELTQDAAEVLGLRQTKQSVLRFLSERMKMYDSTMEAYIDGYLDGYTDAFENGFKSALRKAK